MVEMMQVPETEKQKDLLGAVIMGGQSRRMGQDKAQLQLHGMPQALWIEQLMLRAGITTVLFSVRKEQAQLQMLQGKQLVTDIESNQGPLAGLITLLQQRKQAIFVIAVDMVQLTATTLQQLLQQRDKTVCATTVRNSEGWLEPLCTIWEPKSLAYLQAGLQAGELSPRRLLQQMPHTIASIADLQTLNSANSPQELRQLLSLDN